MVASVSLPIAASTGASPGTIQAIRAVAKGNGVDFAFMVAQAAVESGLDPRAHAATSSARGLFQFVEGTWLAMVRDHGAEVGLADLAGKIGTDAKGNPVVDSAADRRRILALRDDPRLSAEFAARLVEDNRRVLEAHVGPGLGAADLYLAHFLGAGDASRFLGAMRTTPSAAVADLFPVQAAANPGVFYGADGHAKSLSQIHGAFERKLADAAKSLAVGLASGAGANVVARSDLLHLVGPSWRPGQAPTLRLDPLVTLMLASLDAPSDARTDRPRSPKLTERV